ncbi:MAG: hypothetical protein II921_00525 [Treponema sp.]|nr:hypothetical protein [Treponema sp.]
MKKIFLILAAAVVLSSCVTAEKPGKIVEKEFTANSGTAVRKLKYFALTEYDESGNETYYNLESRYEVWYGGYDSEGHYTYYKESDKDGGTEERWIEYDGRGNCIHVRYSDGEEEWSEYDGRGNRTHYKDSTGYETWYEYDEDGNQILARNSRDNTVTFSEYDEMGNCVHVRMYAGDDLVAEGRDEYKYDEDGNCVYSNTAEFGEKWTEYDARGNIIHFWYSDGHEEWFSYDEDGNEIYSKTPQGEYWKEYDAGGRKIREKDERDREWLWEYDAGGNLVWEKWGDGRERFYEYDFHPNGKVKVCREYTSEL